MKKMPSLSKADIRDVIEIIKGLYLSDMIPWICGYSGGKDSTAVVQLVWEALSELPVEKRKKTVHVISTDTLVESPVVALWATRSLEKMRAKAKEDRLPIIPHRLTPTTNNTFWVNLIGRGYPYPRRDFRWCTDRMKIDPSNRFIKEILDAESIQHHHRSIDPFLCHEPLAARGFQDCSSAVQNVAHGPEIHFPDLTIDQAFIPSVDAVDLHALLDTASHGGANRCVHTRRISAARQNSNLFHPFPFLVSVFTFPAPTSAFSSSTT